MKAITQKLDLHKNERGFTLIELLVTSVLTVLMIALVAGIFQSQNNTFVLQNQLNKMQVNGRAATEFLSRAVQNAGYNIFRGTRFLAASDHYLTAVYDQDNDGVIQNDEVMTFAVGNPFSSADETFNLDPFFDMDQDGSVDGTETATYPITMTLTSPPYNLYKVIPDNSGTGFTRNTVARNVDNLIIRYYDKNNNLLPAGIDANSDGIPDTGSYVVPLAELNDIRKVDIEIIARTRDEDPRETFNNTGTYLAGSVATQGGATYSDGFHRQTFTANMAPRNLVMAPWGKMDIAANPTSVNCPAASTAITATLVDAVGDPVGSGLNVNFTASGDATTTLAPVSTTTNAFGEATTTLGYDWSSPNSTVTLSASSLINVGGEENPVFSAIPVEFQSGTGGIFIDRFDGTQPVVWTNFGLGFEVDTAEYTPINSGYAASLNGCNLWQNYEMQANVKRQGGSFDDTEYAGIFLRGQDQNNYYWVNVIRDAGIPANVFRIGKTVGGVQTVLGTATPAPEPFGLNNVVFTIKARIEGTDIKAKVWQPADPADPAADEPGVWNIEVADGDFVQGPIGVEATDDIFYFDDLSVSPI